MHGSASFYMTCSCQSRLSVNDSALKLCNDPDLKTLYPSPPGPFASLGLAYLSLEVFSVFSLCVCVLHGSVMSDSL